MRLLLCALITLVPAVAVAQGRVLIERGLPGPTFDAGRDRDAGRDGGPPPMPDAGRDAGRTCTDRFGDTRGFRNECASPAGECVFYVNVDPDRRMCGDICAEEGWTCLGAAGASSAVDPCAIPTTPVCTTDLRIQICHCAPP